MQFSKNGVSIMVDREDHESDEEYFNRGWFIVSQNLSKYKLEEVVKLSKVWVNIHYNNCKYPKSLTKKVMRMWGYVNNNHY